jgi:tetratricopeptide (TPR) repeat protein
MKRAIVAMGLCALAGGCRSLANRGPVSQSVVDCRQLTQQGINAMERGDWKRAESLLARAVQTSAKDVEARRSYAETLWRRGATQDALVQLEEARRLAVEDPNLAVRTGELHLALGQTSMASRMADEALRLDPRLASAWALRGRVATANRQYRTALADYQRSLGYAPEDKEVALLVAETYRQLNEPQRALLALQALADRYPQGEEPQQILFLQGLAMSALGRHDDAAHSLSLAAHRERPTADILCRLAEAELAAGRYAVAQQTLQHALALDPQYAPTRALAARMAIAQRSEQPLVR